MASFPRDQFDDVPNDVERVGAHRAPRKRGRGWIAFAWATLLTGVLVVVGLVALSFTDSGFKLPIFAETPTPTPTPTVIQTADPVTDPKSLESDFRKSITISVLNGTMTEGLSNVAGDQIKKAGWPNPARASSSNREEPLTYVYYPSAEYEGVARGLMLLIGAADVRMSNAFPTTTITIVLGADYVPPAKG